MHFILKRSNRIFYNNALCFISYYPALYLSLAVCLLVMTAICEVPRILQDGVGNPRARTFKRTAGAMPTVLGRVKINYNSSPQ